jgi:hypothetical protein
LLELLWILLAGDRIGAGVLEWLAKNGWYAQKCGGGMASTEDIVARIDEVLRQNRRVEWTYIFLTGTLFATGIGCFVVALISGQFVWSTPAAVTTGLLHYPLREIKEIRAKNIALATAPMLITQLPPQQAAIEIQKLLQSLYGNGVK